jgi:cytochrome c-type biogenesis protein
MEEITIGLAFIAGVLSFVSPCVLPLVPAYIGYMGGRMTRNVAIETGVQGKVKTNSIGARATMLAHGLAFVLGFTVVFVAIGLMTTAFVSVIGSSVTTLTDIIGRIGGIVIIFFGLHFMGVMPSFFKRLKERPAIISSPITSFVVLLIGAITLLWGLKALEFYPSVYIASNNIVFALPFVAGFVLAMVVGGSLTNPQKFWLGVINRIELLLYSDTRGEMQQSKSSGLGGSFLMGIVFSAGWTPCIGPLLGTILTIAANTGDVGVAVPLLTAYSLGLGIPFLVAALLMEGAQSLIRRLQRQMRLIELASGGLLVIIGILVASGQLTVLSQNLSNQFADFSYRVEECGVGFFRGDVGGQYLGDCLNGTLHPVALNQSMYGAIDADVAQMGYIFTLEDALAVDVVFSRADFIQAPIVVLSDAEGNEVTTSDTWTVLDENSYVSMANVSLQAGTYHIAVSAVEGDEGRFRIKVQETQELVLPDDNADSSDSGGEATQALATEGLEALNTIEDLASISEPVEGVQVGNLAPDFTVTTLGGETLSLSDLRGQVVLINFWGTWCGPCRREMPELQSLYEEHAEDGLTMLGLAVRDTSDAVADFREEYGLSFTLALDEGESISEQYAIPGQPSTLVLDANGVIIFQSYSIVTEEDLAPIITDALPEV